MANVNPTAYTMSTKSGSELVIESGSSNPKFSENSSSNYDIVAIDSSESSRGKQQLTDNVAEKQTEARSKLMYDLLTGSAIGANLN